jgi:hypothetical protein
MYAEEYLPDDAIEYFDVSDVSIDETSSMDTNEKDRKKIHELYKRSDPNYYSFKTVEFNENGEKYLKKTEIYSSNGFGRIRNASGIRENDLVGSKAEDRYFRVKDCGLYTKTDLNTEPRKLFYMNPEHAERHLNIKIDKSIKEAWNNKQLTLR